MAHYFEQGFSVRKPVWHNLAAVIPDFIDLSDPEQRKHAIQLAGHDFSIEEQPVYTVENDDYGPSYVQASGFKALTRRNDPRPEGVKAAPNDGKVLHIAKDSYGVAPNVLLWDVAEALAGAGMKVETAGTLREGAELWVMACLDEPLTIPGDPSPSFPWVVATTTHDGTGALRAFDTMIRVVCWNTNTMALANAKRRNAVFTFRHNQGIQERVVAAKATMETVRQDRLVFAELALELAKTPVSEAQTNRFITEFVPMPPSHLLSDRVVTNIEQARASVRAILGSKTCEGINGTAWGLLQAGIEYQDFYRKAQSQESRFRRTLLQPDTFKQSTLGLIREVVSA